MARRRGIDQNIQVTRGFVTEFTPLAFPQEAATDIDNCIIDADGSVRRRPGLDLEKQAQLNAIAGGVVTVGALGTVGISTHLWEDVNNSGTLNINVYQVGKTLQMFEQVGAPSANLLGEVDLTMFAVDPAKLQTSEVQTATGQGSLYVVGKHMRPVRITFDGSIFTTTRIDLLIRDFEGLDDGLEVDERPTALTLAHYYNLRNQGWSDNFIKQFAGVADNRNLCADITSAGSVSGTDVFPSNADIMTVGIVTNTQGDLAFDRAFIVNAHLGNTPAPKGHFILDPFNKDYNTALGCTGLPNKATNNRPEAVAFHQGRVFYTTPSVQEEVGGVFYSQQLIVPDREGLVFQEADPTAQDINDLVDTDGGFLTTPGVGEIFSLVELGNGIVVLASNGVRFITGADGSGLTATNIKLVKTSKIGTLSASSVIEAEDSIMYFAVDGIMRATVNELGEISVASISQKSIQSFYINISAVSRRKAVGVYIPEQRKIFWAYTDAKASETPTGRGFDRFIVLDFDIQGFYKYSVGTSGQTTFPEIVGLSFVKSVTAQTITTVIKDLSGTTVVAEDFTDVTADLETTTGQVTQLQCAVLAFDTTTNGYKTTFATFHDKSFTDWRGVSTDNTGIAMSSFIEYAEMDMGGATAQGRRVPSPHTKGRPIHIHTFFSTISKNLEIGGYYELPSL